MSISASLANALSGLTAAGRSAEVVSSNVANAMTPGYGRREIALSAQSLGGTGAGVKVDGVLRQVNASILGERRLADADAANAKLRASVHARLAAGIGEPGDDASLSGRITALENALIDAASRPDSAVRLQSVVEAGQRLADKFREASRDFQAARMEADATISSQVETLNTSLREIDRLNAQITALRAHGHDPSALLDQRQAIIDRVAAIVPVREVPRRGDEIALFTTGGAILLEGSPAVIGFTPVGVITADMTLGSGALSGLTLNGRPISGADAGLLGGGSLGALFAQRDDLAPAAQARLDALARDLVERFQSPSVDPTLAPGDAGLFTDGGLPFDPLNEVGLSARIAFSALADPAQGGALWRVRAGLGAAAPGDAGDAHLLQSLSGALAAGRVAASGGFIGASRSASGLAAEVVSGISGAKEASEDRWVQALARQETLTQSVLEDGVDTDAELQFLLQIEQAYAANARVVQTMDDLIQILMRM